MSDRPSLSVVIPFFREGRTLVSTLEDVVSYLAGWNAPWEVLLVGESEAREDEELVRPFLDRFPAMRLLWNPDVRGKGASVRHGMRNASHDLRLFMDADNATRLQEVEKALPLFEAGAQVVIASRKHCETVIVNPVPVVRTMGAHLFQWMYRALLIPGIHDSQCGFKCFTRTAAEILFERQTVTGFAFDVELLAIARVRGLVVREIPVVWKNDYATTKSTVARNVACYIDVVRMAWRRWTGKYR